MTQQLIYKTLEPLKLSQKDALSFEQQIIEADEELISPVVQFIWRKPPRKLRRVERPVYERIQCNEFAFVFKYDAGKPEMLHIDARHSTTPDDAIQLFYSQDAIWHEKRNRFENHSQTHGLYWFWRDEIKKVIMVISCFEL